MPRFIVYQATSPSGRVYVGQTRNGLAYRWRKHVQAAAKGSPLPFHRAIRKYGADAFTLTILERLSTEAGALRAEVLWVTRLGCFGAGGYNATRGGEGVPGGPPWNKGRKMGPAYVAANARGHVGVKRSSESLEKLRATLARPDVRERMAAAHRGRSASEVTRAKMSAAHTGRPMHPDAVEKSAAKRRGVKRTPEAIARMREARWARG